VLVSGQLYSPLGLCLSNEGSYSCVQKKKNKKKTKKS